MQQISSIYLNIHDINKGGQTLFILGLERNSTFY